MFISIRSAAVLRKSHECWTRKTFERVASYPIVAAGAMRSNFPKLGKRLQHRSSQSIANLIHRRLWHPSSGIKFGAGHEVEMCRAFTSRSSSKSKYVDDTSAPASSPESASEHPTVLESATDVDDKYEIEDSYQNELPISDSSFKMTEELFRAAKTAEPGTAASFWSHRLYRGPVIGGVQTRPVVHYCRSSLSTEKVLKAFFMDEKVIGFDLEWKADALRFEGPRAHVSLIQIASEERIALFHIALYPRGDELLSPSLRKLMEDPTITKVGVSIKADCTRFKKHLKVECRGLFELSHLYKLVKYSEKKEFKSINKKMVSLAKQVEDQLHLPLFKGSDVRSSDWSKKLETHQIIYAAADSYAAVQLYKTLEMKRRALVPMPPRPSHAELNIPIKYEEDIEVIKLVDEVDEQIQSDFKLEQAAKISTTTTPRGGVKAQPVFKVEQNIPVESHVSIESAACSKDYSQSNQVLTTESAKEVDEVSQISEDVTTKLSSHAGIPAELNQVYPTEPEIKVDQSTQNETDTGTEQNLPLEPIARSQESTKVDHNVPIEQDVIVPVALQIKMQQPNPEEASRAQFNRDAFFGIQKLPTKTLKNTKIGHLANRMGGGELEATLRAQGSSDNNKKSGTQYWLL